MPSRQPCLARIACRVVALLGFLAVGLWIVPAGRAQQTTVTALTTRSVGGISIDAQGVLTSARRDELGKLTRVLADALQPVPDGMNRTAGLRKVSLRGLEAEIKRCLDADKPLPDAVFCLAGLQRIQYVLVYPQQNDVVLVGPAEGWKVDPRGNLVGATSGRPLMLLDDLVVALRAAASPNRSVMSCSIDPTPEGIKRVEALFGRMRPGTPPAQAAAVMEEQLGPQQISVTGVPETSHFARVLVAADYRMKRVSMGFEPSPVRELPSFMSMINASHASRNLLPRFWLEPEYEPLVRDPDGLAWEVRGGTVRAMAETDFFDAHGIKHPTGKTDPVSQRWADKMTKCYDQLALADPTFGQLRNCMDLAVVAALVVKENLTGKANNRLPLLLGSDGVPTAKLDAPRRVASKAAPVSLGRRMAVAAGGVQINPWSIVERSQAGEGPIAVHRQSASKQRTAWWWD